MGDILGKKINEFRKRKGLTQEELGLLVGVTTQAVSKWERGGTPDAELLPSISNTLGVSIDELFGREKESKQDLEKKIIDELFNISDESEKFSRAFSLCWAIEIGLTGMNSLKNTITKAIDMLSDEHGHEYFSKLMTDGGITDVRLSENGRYFFLMPEPKDGYKHFLKNTDNIARIFALLSDKDILKILFFMYSRTNKAITSKIIAVNTGIKQDRTELLMQKLYENNLADRTEIETEKGEIVSYTFRNEFTVIAILSLAREINVKNMFDFVAIFKREKPLFDK